MRNAIFWNLAPEWFLWFSCKFMDRIKRCVDHSFSISVNPMLK